MELERMLTKFLTIKYPMIDVAIQIQLKGIPTASTNCEAYMIIADVML
jgi:hypothetical protein